MPRAPGGDAARGRPRAVWELVRGEIPATREDRPMDDDIEVARALLRGEGLWALLGEPAC